VLGWNANFLDSKSYKRLKSENIQTEKHVLYCTVGWVDIQDQRNVAILDCEDKFKAFFVPVKHFLYARVLARNFITTILRALSHNSGVVGIVTML
jgi:hypothetical protein